MNLTAVGVIATIVAVVVAAWQLGLQIKQHRHQIALSPGNDHTNHQPATVSDDDVARYLQYLIKANTHVDPRGVTHGINRVTLKLDEIYISLLAVREERRSEMWWTENKRLSGITRDGAHTPTQTTTSTDTVGKVDLPGIVRTSNRIVVLGDPGAGKTTLNRFLTLQFAQAQLQGASTVKDKDGGLYGRGMLPVPVRIAHYADALKANKNLSIRSYISQAFGAAGLNPDILAQMMDRALNDGACFILLDGLDEVVDADDRNEIATHVEQFAAGIPDDNRILITSRVAGYFEARLGGDFGKSTYTLWDMNTTQIERFLNQWCLAFERFTTPDSETLDIKRRATDEMNRVLQAISMNDGVRRLAKNPLLLTILAIIHRDGSSMPNRRVRLYELASRTLLKDWQLSRGITYRHVVEESEALRLLGPLAFWMHKNEPDGLVTEYQAKTILTTVLCKDRAIDPNEPTAEIELAVDDFVRRIREHTGIFVERALGQYGFMHLTFEEYFAGRELARMSHKSPKLIHDYLFDPRWDEPVRLAIGFISETFPETASEIIRQSIIEEQSLTSVECTLPVGSVILAAHCVGDCFGVEPLLAREVASSLVATYLQSRSAQDWNIRVQIGEALHALAATDGGVEAEQLLINALAQDGTHAQWKAAEALGSLGRKTPAAIAALTKAASGNKSSVLKERAEKALKLLRAASADPAHTN